MDVTYTMVGTNQDQGEEGPGEAVSPPRLQNKGLLYGSSPATSVISINWKDFTGQESQENFPLSHF